MASHARLCQPGVAAALCPLPWQGAQGLPRLCPAWNGSTGPQAVSAMLPARLQGWGINHSGKTQPRDSLQVLAFSCFVKAKLHPEGIPTQGRVKIELKEMSSAV